MTMKHVTIYEPGSYNKLNLVDVPIPKPGPGEVLVRIAAFGVSVIFRSCQILFALHKVELLEQML